MTFIDGTAAIWEEDIVIPTYPVGQPDRHPMFLEKRVYQGSSGAVYPFAVIDRVEDDKIDRTYRAVFLENDYLRVMVLPELGGRIQMAYAKHLDYHFVYYNRVIKPALVGLAGPWISGGIEFNWPQHHRPSTFSPVDSLVRRNDDGSVTLWLGEIDRMCRTKSLAGLTLFPGRAYLEVEGRLFNRTALPQTFLWWANIAVATGDDYQSVFPPDVQAVFDHGRRDVSRFPIATGTYYKVDYSPGVDISWYKNIPVPTSYMAYRSRYDFLGGYDHARRAGVFTDNQPDFSWLDPGEEKRFTQYFLPYARIGLLKNAARDAAIALDITEGHAVVGACSTAPRTYRVLLTQAGNTCLDVTVDISPVTPYTARVALPSAAVAEEVGLTLRSVDGKVELSYRPGEIPALPSPEPAKPALPPAEIRTQEELYLVGLHLEQYRHATFRPEDYYEEALRRDPGDARCNLALGLLHLRRGAFPEAVSLLRRAIDRLTMRNANPHDGEPFLYLGYARELQGEDAEAADMYSKAAWNAGQKSAAFAALARLAMKRGDYAHALSQANKSLAANARHHHARSLKVVALRKLGRSAEAFQEIAKLLNDDPLNTLALNERAADGRTAAPEDEALRKRILSESIGNSLELSLEYSNMGCFEEATAVLQACLSPAPALAHFFLGYFAERQGRRERALACFKQADRLPADAYFPNQLEAIPILETAGKIFPQGSRAFYSLGNLFFAYRRWTDAIAAWERAAALDPGFPGTHRNIALAAYNKLGDPARARRELECAFTLDQSDARLLFELDQLRKRMGASPEQRLALLNAHLPLVERRDDLTLERISLLNLQGDHAQARELLRARRFHPWEGGEGKVTRQYALALLGLSKCALLEGNHADAAALAREALAYPENLGEGRLAGAHDNDVHYYEGVALAAGGAHEAARSAFARAAIGAYETSLSMSYNDQPADMIFYQGLALLLLGQGAQARGRFHGLIDHGERHRSDAVSIDYFVVSLPDFLIFEDDLERRNRIFCTYLEGLGRLGLAKAGQDSVEEEKAKRLLQAVCAEDPSHAGVTEILRDMARGWRF